MTERKRSSAVKRLISAAAVAATLGGWVAYSGQEAASAAVSTPPATGEVRVAPSASPTPAAEARGLRPQGGLAAREGRPTVVPTRPAQSAAAPAAPKARRAAPLAMTRSSR